jgi:hypothetical protein
MKTSDSVINIAKALILAHGKIKHATKDATNPHFGKTYASLENVIDVTKQAYLESDIVVLQGMSSDGLTLTTRLQHASGEYYESEVKLMLSKQDMQGLGSAITYARRYSLAAFSNLTQADDDGNAASEGSQRKPSPTKKTETAAKPAASAPPKPPVEDF